jgi:hypothetical protein
LPTSSIDVYALEDIVVDDGKKLSLVGRGVGAA